MDCRRSKVRRACGAIPPATRLPSGPLPVSPAVNSRRDGLTLTPGMKPRPLSTGRSARISRRSITSSFRGRPHRSQACGVSGNGQILLQPRRPGQGAVLVSISEVEMPGAQEAPMRRWMTGRVGIAALAATSLAACSTTTEQGAVGVERRQFLLISSAEVDQAAAAQYQTVLKEQNPKGNLNKDPQQVERVRAIAKRLIPQTAVFRKDAVDWKWEVNVLTSPEVNAWCMPGGKIAVYTGLIEKVQITDDELAAVMGHEMSHALREHSRERASQQAAAGVGASVAGIVADIFLPGTGQLATAGAGLGAQGLYLPPHPRVH